MEPRYAVYYAPPAHSELWRLGCVWLGRDPARDEALKQPAVPGYEAMRIAALTEAPRGYGFHATLKPPFRLREDAREHEIDRALRALAASRRAFALPSLQVTRLGGFLALTPARHDADLAGLANACVAELDPLRRPLDEAESCRRRAAGLSARQDALLTRWGYPYVFEEFRFHLTLTGRIDEQEGAALADWLASWFAPALSEPLTVEDVALYVQSGPGQPFRLLHRYPLRR